MSSKKTISAKNNTVNIGVKKRIDITIYKGLIFLHINDMFNQKSISLTEKEYLTLNKETKKIQKKIANAKALLKEQNKKKKSKVEDSESEEEEAETEIDTDQE